MNPYLAAAAVAATIGTIVYVIADRWSR